MEAAVVLQRVPEGASGPSGAALKAEYPNRAAFLADVDAARPRTAVELDGKPVWNGFGPTIRYRTATDGTIRR
jgi:hypothetical protein